MFQPLDGYAENVIALKAVGKVNADDYASVLAPAVARAAASGGKVRMLLELGQDFDGYDLGGVLADAKLGAADFRSFEKIAVVTDNDLFTHAIRIFAPMIPGAVQVFSVAQYDDARAWVSA